MPSSGASWRIRRHPRAAPLDKEEPRTCHLRLSKNSDGQHPRPAYYHRALE
jgi:hypothetical protein